MKRGLLMLMLIAAPALGQADLPDAGLPDASVGGTGAERASEEEDNGTSDPCLSDRDCDRGFICVNTRCSYRRYREATFDGCGAMTTQGLWLLGVVLLLRRRHFLLKLTK